MKSWIGLRITAEIDGNGPALLRRLLPEITDLIAKGEFGAKVPDKTAIGDITIELVAGPAPDQPPGDPEGAPVAPKAPEPVRGAAEEVGFHG